MTEDKPVLLPELDAPPKKWVDPHDVLETPTEEEIQKGNRLGAMIDPDDDEDNGERYA